MNYTYKDIGTIGVDDESNYSNKTSIGVKVDSLGKAGIRFGAEYSIRLNEEDLNALRELLHDASVQLMRQNDSYHIHGTTEREVEENEYELCLNCQMPYHSSEGDCQDPICNSPMAFLAKYV